VTALILELRLPRAVRGPVDRVELLRFASIFLAFTVLRKDPQRCLAEGGKPTVQRIGEHLAKGGVTRSDAEVGRLTRVRLVPGGDD
jgi:hypothetical protein